ncbi:hypothetical protein BpHYR1_040720 [Brachionus plicatilis]|uniref:FLYWCH-type domain-containing protein n=1 Tax=Brachionus plicatilis TaxID=10195 RepID=A0A3M7P2R8_BRAPC|nr:hypothetical protein BpHYR1_040720 [Brachionus plicatilis]
MATSQLDSLINSYNGLTINKCQITLSQKNKPQLFLNGYIYRFSYESDNQINWRCVVNGCKAKCCTDGMKIGCEYLVSFKNTSDDKHPIMHKKMRKEEKSKKQRLVDAFRKEQKKCEDTIFQLQTGITFYENLSSILEY